MPLSPKYSPQDLAEILKKEMAKQNVNNEDQRKLLTQLLGSNRLPNKALDGLITQDTRMIRLKEKILKLGDKPQLNVLIIGETGTGKEIIARSLHNGRPGKFIDVNCAGIPRELFESEFFGALKGSYTGCAQTREGYFEQAKDGTIFLDEIAEIPYDIQGKLLRVVENRVLRKIGSSEQVEINCRIVSATNNLELHKSPCFRKDLFYRLRGSLLETIPLRERRPDIRLIADYIDKEDKVPVGVIESWTNDVNEYPFEGNVRELKNLIEEYLCLEL